MTKSIKKTYNDPFLPISIEKTTENIRNKVKRIDEFRRMFESRVPGQRAACQAIINWLFKIDSIERDEKPLCLFLVGLDGAELESAARTVAEYLERPFKMLDYSRYSDYQTAVFSALGQPTSYKGDDDIGDYYRTIAGSFDVLYIRSFDSADRSLIFSTGELLQRGTIRNACTRSDISYQQNIFILGSTTTCQDIYRSHPKMRCFGSITTEEIARSMRNQKTKDNISIYSEELISLLANNVVLFDRPSEATRKGAIVKKTQKLVNGIYRDSGVTVTVDKDQLSELILLSTGATAKLETLVQATEKIVRDIYQTSTRKYYKKGFKFNEISVNVDWNSDDKNIKQWFSNQSNERVKPRLLFSGDSNTFEIFESTVSNAGAEALCFDGDLKNIRFLDLSSAIVDICDPGAEELVAQLSKIGVPIYLLGGCADDFEDYTIWGYIESQCSNDSDTIAEWFEKIATNSGFSQIVNEFNRRNLVVKFKKSFSYKQECIQIFLNNTRTETVVDAEHKSKLVYEFPNVTFDDIVGLGKQKADVIEWVEDIKNEAKLRRASIKIQNSILLSGPPGCGKTTLAKAIANAGNTAFIACNGADFKKKYVGEGVKALQEVVDAAVAAAPCVVFIDECDNIIPQRGLERAVHTEDLTNKFLELLDSFASNEKYQGVYFVCATNYDVGNNTLLDKAALDRFSKKITIPLPSQKDREAFLLNYLSKYDNVDKQEVANIASRAVGWNLRSLAHICENSASKYHSRGVPIMEALLREFEEYHGGYAQNMNEEELWQTAVHEASHAIVAHHLRLPVTFVTIIPRSDKAGYVLMAHDEEKSNFSFDEIKNKIAVCLAGRIAEKHLFNEVNTGAAHDIETAVKLAKGVPKLGFIGNYWPIRESDPQEDEIVKRILSEEQMRAENIVRDNIETIKYIATVLLKQNSLTEQEFLEAVSQAEHMKGDR
ncbi:MAG: AAA family ATPase [Clostridia bacterium]|nr:AAA family ATPase [Clostridia bacterium]